MLVYAGIDEAGYGPVIGPLCVGCSVFVLPEYDPASGAPDLWSMLRYAVSKAGGDRKGRIAIDDSKKLKGPKDGKQHPLMKLERGVLSFFEDENRPASDDDLYKHLGIGVPERGWYQDACALPAATGIDALKIASSRLFRHLARAEVRLGGLTCDAVDAPEFNRGVRDAGTKAAVNFDAALRLVQRVWDTYGEHHPRVVIDRQGGRVFYREALQLAWPNAKLTILAETPTLSRYRLERGDGVMLTLTFTPEAERKHLPVALASMTAKYVRELMMARLNRFFCRQLPELKPTAGYFQDGRRFLRDVAPVIESLQIERGNLVRIC